MLNSNLVILSGYVSGEIETKNDQSQDVTSFLTVFPFTFNCSNDDTREEILVEIKGESNQKLCLESYGKFYLVLQGMLTTTENNKTILKAFSTCPTIQNTVINSVVIAGHLVKTPDLKAFPSGTSVCNFSIGISKRTQDEDSKFVKIVAWNKVAEAMTKCESGSLVEARGRLIEECWGDNMSQIKVSTFATDFVIRPKKKQQKAVSQPPR